MAQSLAKLVTHIVFSTKQREPLLRRDLRPRMFSVSPSQVNAVREYIRNQEGHHHKMTFQEELRRFFDKHGLEYDERYVWD